jgi:AcrR family transcriptional regulator
MSTRSQATRVLPRVERRRAEARGRIVAAASRRFAEAGPGAVRMDQVAEAADVARGTLYSHFPTKDDLLCAIVEPVLELAARRAAALARLGAREGVEGLLALYLELWQTYPDALRIAYKAHDIPIGNVTALHRRFLRGVMHVLERASESGLLRANDPALAGHVLRRVAVPLLELYAGHAGWEALFVDSVKGLLTKSDGNGWKGMTVDD